MKKKTIAKTGATMLTMAMLLNGTTVFAANQYTSVNGSSVNIEKYLVVKSTAKVPNVTFNFTITGKTGIDASTDGVQVFAGNDTSRVEGTPTIGTAVFTDTDTTYNTAQDLLPTGGIKVESGTKDPVTLTTGQSYAKHDVSVDFTNVKFKEPGIYRYEITEKTDTTGTIIDDTDTTRIMDVYVIDDQGDLKVQGYVLHNNEETVKQDGSNITADGKAVGYVNKMDARDVKVEKTVTGNQASRDEYFKITLKIEKALPNTTYAVDLKNADATTTTNGANTTSYTNAATIKTGADGKATVDYWLQHGQSIIVRSMNIGATYEMNEDKTVMNKEGYVATITSTDTTGDTIANEDYKVSGKIEKADRDQIDISFSNQRSGVIPTGVIMTVAPFAAVTLLGAAGMVTIKMRKKEDDAE